MSVNTCLLRYATWKVMCGHARSKNCLLCASMCVVACGAWVSLCYGVPVFSSRLLVDLHMYSCLCVCGLCVGVCLCV
jgi:hypothetical protein